MTQSELPSDVHKRLTEAAKNCDSRAWAREFMAIAGSSLFVPHTGSLGEDLMEVWFSNAIMAGYDNANSRPALWLLRQAERRLQQDQQQSASRDRAVAITNLQTAIMWLEKDAVTREAVLKREQA